MLEKFAYFVNIKTILATSPDSYRRLAGSDLGSKCLQGLFEAIFLCHFWLKLYARQAKIN